MNGAPVQQLFRVRDREVSSSAGYTRAEDVLDAMLASIEGGELHLRPLLDSADGNPLPNYIEIGFALRQCLEDKSRRDYLIARLRPHIDVIIGYLPAGILPHGLLPRTLNDPQQEARFRRLEEISDAEVRQWLIGDGGLIYGELKRYEIENYFDAISPLIRPNGVMYDLGSGLGKVVMSAAISLPFARCIGVEILDYRHRMAIDRLNRLLTVAAEGLAALPFDLQPDAPLLLPAGASTAGRHLLDIGSRIEFIEQDMFAVDVSDASLVFIYSTCFGSLMPRIAEKLARELREHTIVTTFTYQLYHPAFKSIGYFPSGTVAWTDAFLYEFVPVADAIPPSEIVASASDTQAWEKRVREEFQALDARADAVT